MGNLLHGHSVILPDNDKDDNDDRVTPDVMKNIFYSNEGTLKFSC